MEKDSEFLKKLLETFKIEAAEHIAAISTGLVELEKPASAQRQAEIIETVFRESHSMKGAARAVNLSTIETLCQSFEDVLSALKRKQIAPEEKIIDLLHRSASLLGEIISSVGETGNFPDRARIGGLLRDFEAIMKGAGTARVRSSEEEAPPRTAGASPAGAALAAGTIRVSKQKLDSILLQTEALLSAKQVIGQRSAELVEVRAIAEALKKDLAKMRAEMQVLAGRANISKRSGLAGFSAPSAGDDTVKGRMKGVLASFEKAGDNILRLQDFLQNFGSALERDRRMVSGMVDGLMDDVKAISMLPFSSVLEIMPKMVRDLAHDRGKEAAFVARGEEIEIDRRILDEIREPLIHLVRNCIDHGIEGPKERTDANKPRAGAIVIETARREGKSVEITVSDDGAGMDFAKIRASAVRLGLISQEEAERASRQKLLSFIFHSGVTTSPIITDISGRGLGLPIVREKVEKLGGSVSCETSEGKGTVFRVILPLTLATFRGVLVRLDERSYVIPVTGLDRTIRIRRNEIKTVENRETLTLENRAIPFVPLRAVLELGPGKKGADQELAQAVVLGAGEQRIAFGVDEIMREQEVLEKDLGKQLARVRNIAGATVLGTGEVVPVLNISDLLKSAARVPAGAPSHGLPKETPAERKSVLVIEDSITSRTLLKNILEAAGYEVRTAVDGLDGFTALKSGRFDAVVSDVDMPRMNGLDLTAKIRADKRFADLPVVLVTALESREDRERGIEVGANAYIVKSSFDQSNLIEVIKRLT